MTLATPVSATDSHPVNPGKVTLDVKIESAKAGVRVMILDRDDRIIAASDGKGILTERFPLKRQADAISGFYADGGQLVGYHVTQGFETYPGLGWKGVVVRTL